MKISMPITVSVILLLTACQSSVMLRSGDSWDAQVTEVKLLQPLTVLPDTTRVFVQDGRVLPGFGYANQYRPHCAFETRDLKDATQTIRPESFVVIRVQGVMTEVVQSRPLKLASLVLGGIDDGGAPMVHEGYHFWFDVNQSNVMRMTCYGVFADMPEVESPSLEDIRLALGEIAELKLQ